MIGSHASSRKSLQSLVAVIHSVITFPVGEHTDFTFPPAKEAVNEVSSSLHHSQERAFALCHCIRSHMRLVSAEVICQQRCQLVVLTLQCDRNVRDASAVEAVRQTGAVLEHYVVTQPSVVRTALRIAALLKPSVSCSIKTAALSGHCSAGAAGT